MNDLVGDLLHVADLMPDISGVDSVSTVTSIPGLRRVIKIKINTINLMGVIKMVSTLEPGTDQWDRGQDSKMFGKIVKPCPITLSPKTHQAQPQPSATQFKTQISSKGTGADT